MNFIWLAGYLGNDPEENFTPNGQKVHSFRLAVRAYRKGEEETLWYRITIWGDHRLLPYIKKGSAVIVGGDLRKPRIYQDREGRPQVSLEVTAEVLRFSPFGKSDRSQQQGGHYSAGESGGHSSFGGALGEEQEGQRQSFGAGAMASFAAGNTNDEDDLPF